MLEEKVSDKMRSIDDRFRSLEERMDLRHEELIGMIARLYQEPRVVSKETGETGRDEVPLTGGPKVSSKGVISATSPHVKQATMVGGKSDYFLRRNQKSSVSFNTPGKLPMPKHPKVEIPIFRGDGDILN